MTELSSNSSSYSAAFSLEGVTPTIMPDGLSGIVFALEGVEGATVLLNGPTGCKYYHSAISDGQTIRQFEFDPLNFPMQWYFGQPRVPCTYLDNSDYVYGSEEKIADALDYFATAEPDQLLCIVNSPGASLIGDDLEGIARAHLGTRPFLVVETPGFSTDVCIGHQTGAAALLDRLIDEGRVAEVKKGRVNVLGFSLFQRNYQGDVAAFENLLDQLSIDDACFVCAGSTLDELTNVPDAELNIVVHPEYGLDTAKLLKERFGTPYLVCDGAPVGFEATERLANEIAERLGLDATIALEACRVARKRAYSFISRLNSLTGLPKGVTFAAEGTYSELYALVDFLVRYLALVPVSLQPVCTQSDCYRERLEQLLDDLGFPEAIGYPMDDSDPELVFGNGTTIAQLRLSGHYFSGVETMLPSMGYYDVVPKTFLGADGALHLIEMVLNGLRF